jgi:predicted ATP-dependent protease
MQKGLSGSQGVLIPATNVDNLMLRKDVVEAVAAGQFHVYPITHVDEGLALLLGRESGERGEDGEFPADSVNRLAEDRMRRFAESRRDDDRRAATRRFRPRRRETS